MLFAPHAGRHPAKTREQPQVNAAQRSTEPELVPTITITTEFRLPPHLAYESLIQEAAALHDVDPSLVRAVMRAESGFDPLAVSSAGAQGLMQLLPEVGEELGVTDPFDPRQNIFAGVRYLRWLLDTHAGDETLALASYNAGPGAVAEHGGVPPFPETEQYVQRITDRLARERALTAAAVAEQRDDEDR
jgi:soluble lytic murein transglycosylase-like protein